MTGKFLPHIEKARLAALQETDPVKRLKTLYEVSGDGKVISRHQPEEMDQKELELWLDWFDLKIAKPKKLQFKRLNQEPIQEEKFSEARKLALKMPFFMMRLNVFLKASGLTYQTKPSEMTKEQIKEHIVKYNLLKEGEKI